MSLRSRATLSCLTFACFCLKQTYGARPALSLDDLAKKTDETTHDFNPKKGSWAKSCSKCSEDLAFDSTFGMEWVIFPPNPFPNPITTLICTPDPSSDKWLSTVETETDENTVCGGPEMLEAMSAEDKEKCLKAAESLRKGERSRNNFVIDVWAKQMWRCGACAVCGIWENLKSLWQGAKKLAFHMVSRFRHKVIGHAPYNEITTMGQRIHVLLAASGKMLQNNADSESLVQTVGTKDNFTAELLDALPPIANSHLKHQLQNFQGELLKHWGKMDKEAREQHMSLLEKSLANMTLTEDDLLYQEAETIHQKLKSKADGIPEVLKQPECEDALKGASMQRTLEISINIEYPNLANFLAAFLLPIPMPETALKSLIPEVLVMAVPRAASALKKDMMKECVDLLNDAQDKFLSSCSSVENFMACTATISQRVFYNLVYQEWWPVGSGHDSTRARPERQPRVAVETMVKSLQGSCLNNDMLNDKQGDERDIMNANSAGDWIKFERFEQMACPFVRNLVDGADGGEGLPAVSDKVWVASLRGFGEAVSNKKWRELQRFRQRHPSQCPEVMPFAAAFCADTLSCITDSDVTGKKLGKINVEFEDEIKQVMRTVDVNRDGVLDADESATAWGYLENRLKRQQQMPFKKGEEESMAAVRAGLWNLMWRSVNATFGGPGGWQAMTAALNGEGKMDWGGSLRNWRRVYDFLFRELRQAELKFKGHGLKSDRMLHEVLHDLNAGYTSTICTQDGLVDFRAHELRTLGVSNPQVEEFMDFQQAGRERQAELTPGAGWRRLLIKSSNKYRQKAFKKEVESYACHCMCYQKSGALTFGTKMSAAEKPTCTRVDEVSPGNGGNSLTPPLAVDEILVKVPGVEEWQKLGQAFLKLNRAKGGSSCRVMLEWELLSGKQAGVGYISPCKAPKPLRTSYMSTPSYHFEIVVYNPALDDAHVHEPSEDANEHEQLLDALTRRRNGEQLPAGTRDDRPVRKWNSNRSLAAIEPMSLTHSW